MLARLAEIVDGAIADVIRARDEVPEGSEADHRAVDVLSELLKLRGGIAFRIAMRGLE